MAERWLIVGAGGFGRELARLILDTPPREAQPPLGGFLDANIAALAGPGPELGLKVLGDPLTYQPTPEDRLLLALGSPSLKRRIVESLESRGGRFDTWVHPSALVASSASLGRGVVLYPFSSVMHVARLGDFAHLSLYAAVGHDAQVGAFATLSPSAKLNGAAVIEEEVFLGTQASVSPGKRVGARSKVSSNSSVMHDVAPDSLVFGVPGRHVRFPGPDPKEPDEAQTSTS